MSSTWRSHRCSRCITSCSGCEEEQHQTNEQQKPILPHPRPEEPKVCSGGQVKEVLIQFGVLMLVTIAEKPSSALRTFSSSVMQRLREPCWTFLVFRESRPCRRPLPACWSPRAASQPPIKSLGASQSAPISLNQLQSADQVASAGLHGSTGCDCSGVGARATAVRLLLLLPNTITGSPSLSC